MPRDPARELAVRGRVVAVDSAAEHRYRYPVGIECSSVRFTVDPAREPADDDEPRRRELSPERPSDCTTVGRARAGSDDRNGREGKDVRRRASAQPEYSRRVGNLPKKRRIGAVAQTERAIRHGAAIPTGER